MKRLVTSHIAKKSFATAAAPTGKVRPFSEIPVVKEATVWHDHLHNLINHRIQRFEKLGPVIFRDYQSKLTLPRVTSCNPEDFEAVFQADGRTPLRPEFIIGEDLIINRDDFNADKETKFAVTLLNGDDWLAIRRPLNRLFFSKSALLDYYDQHMPIVEDFITSMYEDRKPGTNQIPDMFHKLRRLTYEMYCKLSFDERVRCVRDVHADTPECDLVLKKYDELIDYQGRIQVGIDVPVSKFNPDSIEEDHVNHFIEKRFSEGYEMYKKLNDPLQRRKRFPIVDRAFQDETNVTAAALKYMISVMLEDGTGETPVAFGCQVYLMAINPETQKKAFEEVREKIGLDPEAPIDYNSLKDLTYLKAVIKEGHRIFPPLRENDRLLSKDIVIPSGYELPKGTAFRMDQATSSMYEKYVPEPNRFMPERWLGQNKYKPNPFVTLPFSYGARSCLGQRLVEFQNLTYLIRMIQHFEFKWAAEDTFLPCQVSLLNTPLMKDNMVLIPRNLEAEKNRVRA